MLRKCSNGLPNKTIDTTTAISANKLLIQADWQNAHTITADSGKTYEVTPLFTSISFADTSKILLRYLALEKQQNKITDGFIYEILGNKTDAIDIANQLVKNFDQLNIKNFNGTTSIYSWNGNIKRSRKYLNGVNISYTIIVSKPHVDKTAIQDLRKHINTPGGACIDWYRDIYVNGSLIYEEYLGSTCPGDTCDIEGVKDNTGNVVIKMNCAGGGGHSSSPEPQVSLDVDFSENESQYANEDYSNNSYPEAISYDYHYLIYRGTSSGQVKSVTVYPVTASPIVSTYIDLYGRNTTRRITLLNQMNNYQINGTIAKINWSWSVNERYTYTDGSPTFTDQIDKSYSHTDTGN